MKGARAYPAQSLVLTCEHGGNRVPPAHASLFSAAAEVLESHRGWDPGALPLARLMARRLQRPLHACTWSRLLVESNRSPTNPRIWSEFTRSVPRETRQQILHRYWWPHRHDVERAVAAAIDDAGVAVHVGVHTFTPVLNGDVRNADVTLLFDSARTRESTFARLWGEELRRQAPELRLRYNYPYRGNTDGLTTWLRRKHPASRYLGLELEVNQATACGPHWRKVGEALTASLRAALARAPASPRR